MKKSFNNKLLRILCKMNAFTSVLLFGTLIFLIKVNHKKKINYK